MFSSNQRLWKLSKESYLPSQVQRGYQCRPNHAAVLSVSGNSPSGSSCAAAGMSSLWPPLVHLQEKPGQHRSMHWRPNQQFDNVLSLVTFQHDSERLKLINVILNTHIIITWCLVAALEYWCVSGDYLTNTLWKTTSNYLATSPWVWKIEVTIFVSDDFIIMGN